MYVDYIKQSLEVLEAMEDCIVAKKISQFSKDFLESLLCDPSTSKEQPIDQSFFAMHNLPFSDFPAFFPGHNGEFQLDAGTFNFFEPGSQDFLPPQTASP
jgi:hypothetical protein